MRQRTWHPWPTQTSTPADAGAPPVVTTAAQETALAEPSKPIEFEKIPAIAVEVRGAVTPFSVAPIVVEPLAPVLSSKAPVISPIPPIRRSADPSVTAREAGFAIYVPPIVERAAVNPTPPPVLATPTLPALIKPPVEREFASYVPPPVVPQAQAPSASLDTLAIPSAAVVAPPAPMLQIAPARATEVVPIAAEPIAPLNLSPVNQNVGNLSAAGHRCRAGCAGRPTPANTRRWHGPARGNADGAATAGGIVARKSGWRGCGTFVSRCGASALLNSPLPLPSPAIPAAPASALPSTNAPKLDLDQLRRQAREVTKEGSGSRALLPFPMVAKETPKKDMEKIFDKALKRPDCKDAYADLGLLAVVPL